MIKVAKNHYNELQCTVHKQIYNKFISQKCMEREYGD